MRKNTYDNGMICSKTYADWMLKKNSKEMDFPATSYYKLVRLFSRTNYRQLFEEEVRKGNDFYYSIVNDGEIIRLEPSYELVFLPYESAVTGSGISLHEEPVSPIPVTELVFGYRILQTRGFMPGTHDRVFSDWHYSMEYLVDDFKTFAKHLGQHSEDTYRMAEFQSAEQIGFVDNEMPYSFGPQCPDRVICELSYVRVIIRLMREIERLGLASVGDGELYELRMVAYLAAILTFASEDRSLPISGMISEEVSIRAEKIFSDYASKVEEDLNEVCRMIRCGIEWDFTVVIDYSSNLYNDYDYDDVDEAPIGLTASDYERFGYADTIIDEDYEEEWDLDEEE